MDRFVFSPADILIPGAADMEKWSVVACDQFTAQPEYWAARERESAGVPSALHLMLPEAYLAERDPIAEAEIYSKFNEIAGDKTAIYISHRLSSCKFCDEIAVFDHGEVIQQGTHDALVADTTGKYYELWNAQAQYYTEA